MHHPTDRIAHTTACGALAGTRNSSMGPPWRIDPKTHRTMSERSYHGATSRSRTVIVENGVFLKLSSNILTKCELLYK